MKHTSDSRKTSQYVKKCITVCVQGHGSIESKDGVVDFIKKGVRNNATILTIPSGISRKGLMYAECPTMTMSVSLL
jgi:FixJ family two-component response regulator